MSILANIFEKAVGVRQAGTSAFLALALGTAPDAANRIGLYADTTAAAEQLVMVVGAQAGPAFLRSGSSVIATALKVDDATFQIVEGDKSLAFQVGTQSPGFQLTVDVGAQVANRTLSVPALTANATLAVLSEAQTFTGVKTFDAENTNFGASGNLPTTGQVRAGGNDADFFGGLYLRNTSGGTQLYFLVGGTTGSTGPGWANSGIIETAGTSLRLSGYGGQVVLTTGASRTSRLTVADALATLTTPLSVTDTTDSTSKDTGSIVTEGGLGVEKAATIGTTLTVGGLTSGRIPFASTAGLITDSANLTFGSSNQAIGLRRTPHGWGPLYAVVEFQGTALAEYYGAGNVQANWNGNTYDIGAGDFRASESGTAAMFRLFPLGGGLFRWQFAPSVAADAPQTFASAMELSPTDLTLSNAVNLIVGTVTGTKIGTATSQKIGLWNATPIVQPAAYTQTFATAARTVSAYSADSESVAYTGIDNAQAGTVYAQLTDLNALRTAYENLRAMTENIQQVINAVIDDHQAIGLCA